MSPRTIYTLPLFSDDEIGPAIPSCANELRDDEHPTVEAVAQAQVDRVREWRTRNPSGNWRDIVPPTWLTYVAWHLGESLEL